MGRQERQQGQGIAIVNVRLPSELAQWIDGLVSRGLYKSRSEAIREFSRKYVLRQR